jgi:glycosyltransferase involved in cell wall biosynthesis
MVMRPLRRYVLRQFDAHHYGGNFSKRALSEIGVPPESMFFVPYSVDTPYFAGQADDAEVIRKAAEIRGHFGIAPDAKLVLFIGQHSWIKGPDIAIDAIAEAQKRISELQLVIVGGGVMTEELKARAAARLLPGSYYFAGFIPSKSTMPYYLASDVVIFTSHYETWGRAVNEAMLARRPCIVNNMMAVSGDLVLSERNGVVLTERDPSAYAQAIVEYFRLDKITRCNMGEEARRQALHFSYEDHLEDVIRCFYYAAKQTRS